MCIGQRWETKPMHQTGISLREVLSGGVGSPETGRGEDVCLHRLLDAGLPLSFFPLGYFTAYFTPWLSYENPVGALWLATGFLELKWTRPANFHDGRPGKAL